MTFRNSSDLRYFVFHSASGSMVIDSNLRDRVVAVCSAVKEAHAIAAFLNGDYAAGRSLQDGYQEMLAKAKLPIDDFFCLD